MKPFLRFRRLRPALCGFTLVEVLVVIAIIGILSAMIFPAFSAAKLKAYQVQCANHLKQMSMASLMYMNDSNGECLPYDQAGRGLWMGTLIDYQSKVGALRFCPLASDTNTTETTWGTADKAWNWAPNATAPRWYGSYAMNGWLYSNLTNMPDADQPNVFRNAADIRKPSATPIFADAVWLDCWPRTNDLPAFNLYRGYHGNRFDGPLGRLTIPRHGGAHPSKAPRQFDPEDRMLGSINLGFVDGHVELAKLESLWSFSWHRNWVVPSRRPD